MKGLYTQYSRVGPFFSSFWTQHPALFYGLFLYLGAVGAVYSVGSLLLPLSFLFLGAVGNGYRLSLGCALALLFGLYVASTVEVLPEWADGRPGKATFQITNVTDDVRYNRAYYKLQVDLLRFESADNTFFAQNLPCKMVWNKATPRPRADFQYQVEATVTEHNGAWTLHALPNSEWVAVKPSFSLVEWRYRLKNGFKRLLAEHIPPSQVRAFLEGVVIGEFHDPLLANNLRRFGLQHIIVVSGFHFALIAAIFQALLRLFASWRATSVLLIALTSFYLIFVGPSPSVVRAYIAGMLVLLARLCKDQSNGLNSLGVGLLIALAIEPIWATSLSFTLSFLATFAILLFFPLCKRALGKIFPKRRASELLKMPFLDQLTFVLLSFFLSSFALVASVTILMLPMSLFAFHQFPLMGIIYNCFFPFLISISVFLLCLGLLFSWLAPLASIFFSACTFLTEAALTLVNDAPSWLDMTLQCSWLTAEWLTLYLCCISFLGIISYARSSEQ